MVAFASFFYLGVFHNWGSTFHHRFPIQHENFGMTLGRSSVSTATSGWLCETGEIPNFGEYIVYPCISHFQPHKFHHFLPIKAQVIPSSSPCQSRESRPSRTFANPIGDTHPAVLHEVACAMASTSAPHRTVEKPCGCGCTECVLTYLGLGGLLSF